MFSRKITDYEGQRTINYIQEILKNLINKISKWMRVNAEFWGGKVEIVAEFDIFFENSQVMEASKDKLF